ncbi:hypothetical protein ABKV19_003769 [Rosa sericea]
MSIFEIFIGGPKHHSALPLVLHCSDFVWFAIAILSLMSTILPWKTEVILKKVVIALGKSVAGSIKE